MKNKWWQNFLHFWLRLIVLLSSIVGVTVVNKYIQSLQQGQAQTEVTGQVGVREAVPVPLRVPEFRSSLLDGQDIQDIATIDISHVSGSEQTHIHVTAPTSQMAEIALRVETETGFKVDIQPDPSTRKIQGRPGGRSTQESRETSTFEQSADTTAQVLTLIAAVFGAYAARMGLQTALVSKQTEELKRRNERTPVDRQPEPNLPLQAQKAVHIMLNWQEWAATSSNSLQLEQTPRSERFTIPPQAVAAALRAIEVRLIRQLPLTIHIFLAFST